VIPKNPCPYSPLPFASWHVKKDFTVDAYKPKLFQVLQPLSTPSKRLQGGWVAFFFVCPAQTCSSWSIGWASGIRHPASHTCAALEVMICFISHGNRWQSFRPHTDRHAYTEIPYTPLSSFSFSSSCHATLRFMFSCKQNNGHA